MSTSQTLLVEELYAKLENAHLHHEMEMSEVTSSKNSLLDVISNLNFELETMSDRYRHYKTSFETLKQEMIRLESDFKQSRDCQMQMMTHSQRSDNLMRQENDSLRGRCQDLELKLES